MEHKMPDKLERDLKSFAKKAELLAGQVEKEGAGPSIRGPGGVLQAHVHVKTASSPDVLVVELQNVATSIGLYLKTRRVGLGQPPDG